MKDLLAALDIDAVILRDDDEMDSFDDAVEDYRDGGEANDLRQALFALGASARQINWQIANRNDCLTAVCPTAL